MSEQIESEEEEVKGPETCPRCGAAGLFKARMFGRDVLNEDSPHGQGHTCPDIAAENHRLNMIQVERGKALERERRFDTTGNRKPRWAMRGGPTGDVEPY